MIQKQVTVEVAGGEVEEAAVIRQLSGITVDMFQ
jgi:hypothetical protein